MRSHVICCLIAAGLGASPGVALCQNPTDDGLADRLQAHVEFLADDLLAGRLPGTAGYDIAARYVASQFRQAGLEPAGTGGGWYQPVPLRRAYLESGSAELVISGPDGDSELTWVEDFFTGPSTTVMDIDRAAPLVFAGYGIDAPPLGHDDYAGLDVEGRIVVILSGQPHDFPSEEGAHFASSRERYRAAAARGAVGVLRIHTPRTERVRTKWEQVDKVVGQPSMAWLEADGRPHGAFPSLEASARVFHAAAGPLFAGAPLGLEDILALDEAGEAIAGFPLAGRARLRRRSTHDLISSDNVVGVLPGSDPSLAGEYVVYTAHLDHIGTLAGERQGDVINNGALDNASGVAVLIETARRMAAAGAPRRSVLFLAVTAEEMGLLGAGYYANNPTVLLAAMTAVINLDMPLLLYDFADVVAFGAERSTMERHVRAAARAAGSALASDPFPEQNVFVRSDHYRFVQQGIPAIFLVTGPTSRDAGVDGLTVFREFLGEHYHKPSDESDLAIDYVAGARFTRINQGIGERIANAPERVRWNEGDFFGETFAR